ncbi:Uncharacterised protein [Moraxella equi]|uniref:Uncharacterized protein n=1 Tax=Moraxella equi TaxID=60442 RepID=A0A378QQ48_9GAMM|nr:hypothetical protein B5J93_01690 [Moraxella equi]STZ03026.1 Uncharacterised protein [Moraxella equi]
MGVLSTPFDDITIQGVLSNPLRLHIIVFVIILKFLGCIRQIFDFEPQDLAIFYAKINLKC